MQRNQLLLPRWGRFIPINNNINTCFISVGPPLSHEGRAEIEAVFAEYLATTGTRQVPRLSLDSHDTLNLARDYLSRNIAIVLTDTHLWDNGAEGTIPFNPEFIMETVHEMDTNEPGLYKAYMRGKNFGREDHFLMDSIKVAARTWKWPPLLDTDEAFRWVRYNMYGSYAGNSTAHTKKIITDLINDPKMMHTDMNCCFAFAVLVHGVKAYTLQAPSASATTEWKDATCKTWERAGGARMWRYVWCCVC
jgi:hypothetical protein